MDEIRTEIRAEEIRPNDAGEKRPDEAPQPVLTASDPQSEAVRQRVVEVLKTCYDPEIPVDIYELGLIYAIDVNAAGVVKLTMTLTSPMCPVAESLPGEVKQKLQDMPSVTGVELELVWEPPWEPSRMSDAARLELGF